LEHYYYILNDVFTTDKESLKTGVRIMKIPTNLIIDFAKGEGPFDSIKKLKNNSKIFKNLQNDNSKRAQQIFLDKNICKVKGYALREKDKTVNLDFIKLLEHSTKGRIIGKKVSGVHYYNSKRVKIIKVIRENKLTRVFEAEIKFLNLKTNEWIKKEKPTTFFPLTWNENQLFHECEFAYNNMKKKENSDKVYSSKTISNIRVEIIKINGKVKSIYPLI
jgi:Bacterial EndoU nuclease